MFCLRPPFDLVMLDEKLTIRPILGCKKIPADIISEYNIAQFGYLGELYNCFIIMAFLKSMFVQGVMSLWLGELCVCVLSPWKQLTGLVQVWC